MTNINEHQRNKKLTTAELGDLFANYLGDSMHYVIFEHFSEVVEDEEIKEYITYAKSISQNHLLFLEELYTKEEIPCPIGFGEEDLHRGVPRLFSDIFMAVYTLQMAKAGVVAFSESLTTATRQDVIDYFKKGMQDAVTTYEKGVHLLLEKGEAVEAPMIPYPKKVDFVNEQSFISMLTTKIRPLTAMEIKYLHRNINTNILGKALMLGYGQVTTCRELEHFFREGVKVADHQIRELSQFLVNENLPAPKVLDTEITDSTTPPWSDKLLLFHTGLSNGFGIHNYGSAISKILRHDVAAKFMQLTAGIGKYANDGLELMIKKNWLEQPPTCPNRQQLSNANAPRENV